jgi:hypothetical protein
VSLYLLRELFLDLLPEELLLDLLLLELVLVLLERVECILEVLLVVGELEHALSELPLEAVDRLPVLLVQLRDHHLVVRLATVLEQDREHAPHRRQQDVLVRSVVKATLQHLIVTDTINKEASIHTVHLVTWDACICQRQTVDAVTRYWILVFWFKDNSWNVKMFSIKKSIIDPRLDYFWVQSECRVFSHVNLSESCLKIHVN